MTEYGKDEWIARAIERRAARDEERARFVAEAGTQPVSSLDEIQFSPAQQRKKVISLMKVARDGGLDANHMEAMVMMARAIATTGLGAGGGMADVACNVLSPHDSTSARLLEFFTLDYDMRSRG
ncbi:hypothetical protein V8J82_00050 [Gymnodinialimonas sp. 2305UL16-5]|uniref:hypothetical protein n=1 Tax=Gymnodinialimonas mytili TaxID=3126503 RepID=UPI0030B06EF5